MLPGDRVLLIPEYQHFVGAPLDGSPKELAAIFEFDHMLPRLFTSPRQYWNLVRGLPQLEPGKLVWLQRSLGQGSDLVYRRDAFNTHGDVVSHLDRGSGDGGSRPLFLPGESTQLVGEAFELLAEAIVSIRERGGEPLVSYPSISTTAYQDSEPIISRIRMRLEGVPTVQVVGSPEDFLLPPDRFYDSPYHLTRDGRQERTQRLIERLRLVETGVDPLNRHLCCRHGEGLTDPEQIASGDQ